MEHEFIHRELSRTILEAYKYFSVITITGPRQSGKTTLIRNCFPSLLYSSLENLNERDFALNDPIAFLSQSPLGMILDEVQNAPNLLSYIQGIVDNNPNIRFILSGSSQFALSSKISQSLSGRTAIFELLPMSFLEIKDMVKKMPLDELLFSGFYPSIHAGKNIPKFFYPSYEKTYLDKDVRDLLQVKNMLRFHTFVRLCATRIASVFNASALANEVGVSTHTINEWLSVLQASYIVFLLPSFYENQRKRLIKAPKLYFLDTGLACHLLGIESPKQLVRDKMRGELFENFIVIEALKYRFNKGLGSNLYFYRDSNHNEIDLLIKEGSAFSTIEIKSSETYHQDFEKTLKKADSFLGNNVNSRAIIYAGTLENTLGEIKLLNYSNIGNLLEYEQEG
ncbi:MAG: ATP-binding protein [Prevotella sp.]|nr:ATP-binding protein [Prevotella sp.]